MQPGLVIVSNRLPVSVKKVGGKLEFYPSIGGLATGLASYAEDSNNKWIGWPGIASDELTEKERQQIADELRNSNCYPVFLTQKQLDAYYNGYSNSVLWPLFHDGKIGSAAVQQQDKWWRAYQRANQLFADVVLGLSSTGDTIWVHDYQLLVLPALLRLARPYDKIGFFLHIPFPAAAQFAQLADGEALIAGMLGADLIGLHVGSYVNNFLDTVSHYESGLTEHHKVILPDRVVRVTDFPMGIDYDKYVQARQSDEVETELVKLKLKYFGQKVILTVDRLDPAKGLVERAHAYQTLLRENPRLRGKVVLVMLVVPSRTDIKEYQQLKRRLERLIGDINAEFGTRRWQPVDYLPMALPFAQVTAYYRRADVAFIAPLRDGMNLVAKEYLASQPQRGGALILSQTAGAAEELKDAIVVNPRDPATLVTGLLKALTMPPRELQRRVGRMQRHLSKSNVHVWAGSFTKALKNEVRLPGSKRTVSLGISASNALRKAYRQASHRLLLLDYDGVLERFHALPENAAPSDELSQLLTTLGQHTQLVLISGRRKADLDAWFDGLPLTLVAEHGLHTKQPGGRWHTHRSVHVRGWYRTARQLMEKYAVRTPGAFVEQKDASLVWHYRDASPYYAQKHLVALKRGLKPLAAAHGLQIEQGNEILELRPAGVTKGSAAHGLLQSRPDFILAMGDDYTDEDMFTALPTNAYTIKVGRGRTAARYRLNGVKDVLALLEKLQKID